MVVLLVLLAIVFGITTAFVATDNASALLFFFLMFLFLPIMGWLLDAFILMSLVLLGLFALASVAYRKLTAEPAVKVVPVGTDHHPDCVCGDCTFMRSAGIQPVPLPHHSDPESLHLL